MDTSTSAIDEKLESTVGFILRAGVYTSAALALIGGVYYLSGNAPDPAVFHNFDKEALQSRDLSGIIKNVSCSWDYWF
jgi:hypothetical protein